MSELTRWGFRMSDLTENIKIEDQEFSPHDVAVMFLLYDLEQLPPPQMIIVERLIAEGTMPSRRQYQLAQASAGILRNRQN